MKLLTFTAIFFLSFPTLAVTLEKQKSLSSGTASQKFEIGKSSIEFHRNTNFFGELSDYRIGKLTTKKLPDDYAKLLSELEALAKSFENADTVLKTRNSSFNDVSGPAGHATVLRLNSFQITEASKHFADLNRIFLKLQALKWELSDGYKVDSNLTQVETWKAGKVSKKDKYHSELYCQKDSGVCTYYGGGSIFLPEKIQ